MDTLLKLLMVLVLAWSTPVRAFDPIIPLPVSDRINGATR
jgi:hypothetical protein